MRVKCSTCLEILLANSDITTTPCGHAFHFQCVIQWLETGKKNCPQCRTTVREKDLRRIYFAECDESDPLDDLDTLNHKIESLTYDKTCHQRELRAEKEEKEKYKEMHSKLVEKVRTLERKINNLNNEKLQSNSVINDLKLKESYYLEQKKIHEATKSKLETIKNVELILKGTTADVNAKMSEMGDYSKSAREMSTIMITMKKTLEENRKEINSMHAESMRTRQKSAELKRINVAQTKKINEMEAMIKELKSDLAHKEDQIPCSSNHIPEFDKSPDTPVNGSYLKTKNNLIVGLDQERKRKFKITPAPTSLIDDDDLANFNILKKPKSSGSGLYSQLNNQSFNKIDKKDGLAYNGLGGHEAENLFPTKKRNPFKAVNSSSKGPPKKAPKGVSKPVSSIPKIGTFFSSLETP